MPEGPQRRLAGRNGAIWQAHLDGATQESLAEQFGLSQSAISKILLKVRDSIPAPVIDDIRKTSADRIAVLYAETMKIMRAPHPLVSVQRGTVIFAPVTEDGTLGANELDEDGQPIGARYVPLEDDGPKLAAIAMALRIEERVAKAHGTDAATKVETSGTVKFEIVGVDVDQI